MSTLTNRKLLKRLKNKGIVYSSQSGSDFKKQDYFQTVNAYKYLFADGAKDIEQIFKEIDAGPAPSAYDTFFGVKTYANKAELKEKILDSILEQYDFESESRSPSYSEKYAYVKDNIKFHKHNYNSPDF